jgi:hypothetical protein
MIWQFHHQWADRTEMKSQREFPSEVTPEMALDHQEWVREQVAAFPPPVGATNMICNELSKFFVGTVADDQV